MSDLPAALGVDLDDVLGATTPGLTVWLAEEHDLTLGPGDITSLAHWCQHGVTDEDEAIRLVHGYELAGYPGLEPIPGAQEAINRLGQVRELRIITARDPMLDEVTREWLNRHFGDAFSRIIHVGNRFVSEGDIRPKGEICQETGVSGMIDDSLEQDLACARLGVRAYLFGGYAWNALAEKHELITATPTWADVTESVLSNGRG